MPDQPQQQQGVYLTPEQFAILQRGQLLLQKLSQTATTKRGFERLVKEIVPEVETTDDIIQEGAKPYIEELTATRQKLDDYLAAQDQAKMAAEEAKAAADLSGAFSKLRSEGLTEAGEAEVRQIMIDRNVADPMAAFALWERNNPKPVEGMSSWEPQSWNYQTNAVDRDIKGLFEDPDKWSDIEVGHVLTEMRRPQQL